MKPSIFARITKVDEAKRLVFARAVQEVPDKVDEIFDYAGSKPYFEEWSKMIFDASNGKSYGNVRAMHGKSAAGRVAEPLTFNDAEKAIDVCVHVSDDQDWRKAMDGTYTGLSIGGAYVGPKKAEKIGDREVQRYIAKPSEISLVDNPCIPTATFFEIVKADGTIAKVDFKPAAQEPELEVKGSPEDIAAFAKALNDAGLTMADATALVKAKAPAVGADGKPVEKGMWNVADFASALSSLAGIARSAQYDLEAEGDASPVPASLRKWLGDGVAIFKAMAAEEADELVSELAERAGGLDIIEAAARVGDLQKRLADPKLPAIELVKIATEHGEPVDAAALGDVPALVARIVAKASGKLSAANKDRLQAAHDHIAAIGAMCGAAKVAPADPKKETAEAIAKAVADAVAPLQAEITMLKNQPVPHVSLRTTPVAKTQDNGAASAQATTKDGLPELTKADYIYNRDGTVDWGTSYFMKARKLASATAGN